MKKLIATALVTCFSTMGGQVTLSKKAALSLLDKTEAIVYRRLRKMGGGDTMLASKLVSTSVEDRRDATFVRVSSLLDFPP
jgi:hypothetical protein